MNPIDPEKLKRKLLGQGRVMGDYGRSALRQLRGGLHPDGRDLPPIDAVYTWAGPSTPEMSEARAARAAEVGKPRLHACRWADQGELRYSLRSLARFGRWFRRVHIVVAHTPPAWLDPDHPWIHVVRHADIFPDPTHLPTFSGTAIEAHLHRIPGLAERFVYFNDDMMFGGPTWPSMFFGRAPDFKPQTCLQYRGWPVDADPTPPIPEDEIHRQSWRRVARLLDQRFGADQRVRPGHHAKAVLTRVLASLEHDPVFADAMTHTSATPFMVPTEIPPVDVAVLVALHSGLAQRAAYRTFFLAVTDDLKANRRRFWRALLSRPTLLCVEDGMSHDSTAPAAQLTAFMERYCPVRAPWER